MARRVASLLAIFAAVLVGARLGLPLVAPGLATTADSLTAEAASLHVGEQAEVCGIVASAKHSTRSRSQPTFLNLDRPYPDHIFTALIWGKDRSRFPYAPETLEGERICVRGIISLYKDKPQIILSHPSQLTRQHAPFE